MLVYQRVYVTVGGIGWISSWRGLDDLVRIHLSTCFVCQNACGLTLFFNRCWCFCSCYYYDCYILLSLLLLLLCLSFALLLSLLFIFLLFFLFFFTLWLSSPQNPSMFGAIQHEDSTKWHWTTIAKHNLWKKRTDLGGVGGLVKLLVSIAGFCCPGKMPDLQKRGGY